MFEICLHYYTTCSVYWRLTYGRVEHDMIIAERIIVIGVKRCSTTTMTCFELERVSNTTRVSFAPRSENARLNDKSRLKKDGV